MSNREIAEHLGCSEALVAKKISELGLSLSPGERQKKLLRTGAVIHGTTGRPRTDEEKQAVGRASKKRNLEKTRHRVQAFEREQGESLKSVLEYLYCDLNLTTAEISNLIPFSKAMVRRFLGDFGLLVASGAKLRSTGRARGKNNPMYGRPPGNWKRHYRKDLGLFFRSSWEANYARYLNYKGVGWKYETSRFELSDGTTYIPDFYLTEEDRYVEIKGYLSKIAEKKLMLFRTEYPSISLEIIDETQYRRLEALWKLRVPNWETPRH